MESLKPVIDKLENLFSKFNEHFYGGELQTPIITVSPDTTKGAYGWCTSWKAWKQQVKVDAQGNEVTDLFKYHEVQYGVQEYVEQIGKENASLTEQVKVAQKQVDDTQLALCEVYEMIDGLGV